MSNKRCRSRVLEIGLTLCLFGVVALSAGCQVADAPRIRHVATTEVELRAVDGQIVHLGRDSSAPALLAFLAVLPEDAKMTSGDDRNCKAFLQRDRSGRFAL